MTSTQQSLLRGARGNVEACLLVLRLRAAHGAKARPTVAELNEILDRLTSVSDAIAKAPGGQS